MNTRGFDAAGSQESLQRELDDLLRFAHDVGPTLRIEEDLYGAQANPRAAHVIEGQISVAHPQATSGHSCPIRLAVRHLANDPSLDDVSPDLRQAPRNVKCPLEEDDCVQGDF